VGADCGGGGPGAASAFRGRGTTGAAALPHPSRKPRWDL